MLLNLAHCSTNSAWLLWSSCFADGERETSERGRRLEPYHEGEKGPLLDQMPNLIERGHKWNIQHCRCGRDFDIWRDLLKETRGEARAGSHGDRA